MAICRVEDVCLVICITDTCLISWEDREIIEIVVSSGVRESNAVLAQFGVKELGVNKWTLISLSLIAFTVAAILLRQGGS